MVAIRAKPQSGTNLMRKYEMSEAKKAWRYVSVLPSNAQETCVTHSNGRIHVLSKDYPLRLDDEEVDELLHIVQEAFK